MKKTITIKELGKIAELSEIIEILYLDYFNNFLTIERFAEYYGISERLANEIILRG